MQIKRKRHVVDKMCWGDHRALFVAFTEFRERYHEERDPLVARVRALEQEIAAMKQNSSNAEMTMNTALQLLQEVKSFQAGSILINKVDALSSQVETLRVIALGVHAQYQAASRANGRGNNRYQAVNADMGQDWSARVDAW